MSDIRIVNICNNNCIYCLESSYRKKNKYESLDYIYFQIKEISKNTDFLGIFGGNPLLHPNLLNILNYARTQGINNISILTNTYKLDKNLISDLEKNGLTGIGFYFNTFDKYTHELVSGGGIGYEELLKNINLISKSDLSYKAIIHINKQNIENLYKDVFILYKKFGVESFEFIGFFPFDKPYEKNNRNLLFLDYNNYRKSINKLFDVLDKIGVETHFIKFPRSFFGNYGKYYDYKFGVYEQLGKEDIQRLKKTEPYCKIENRCKFCFLIDYCNNEGIA
ncbi:radical SAM protein [Candidatus Absconditicoccus praedator]|uniref:radical SAM protein n=1 Tax=Candidatus Absconditicoccus praedator TaxID=2735562 RepID=UPI001E4EBFF7|nr:radical SAM protein [Candidatus Absconditicoccus praedator]UFX83295.1 radical SAM protein [Candidatus Absconditicoccus praedator]